MSCLYAVVVCVSGFQETEPVHLLHFADVNRDVFV